MVAPRTAREIPTTEEAVAASVACARLLGLPADRPEIIAEGYSVRVHLQPAPVVTRVLTVGGVLRGEPLPWMRREIAVAGFLAAAGAPVAPPWDQPGPYVVNGLAVSLWQWVEHEPGTIAPAAFGAQVHDLHRALSSYAGQLPPLVGPLTDVGSALTLSTDSVLHGAARTLIPLALSWPRRPLHGDAHPGNVLLTADGPRWTDFEDTCVGPIEWDLASRQVGEEAIGAYQGDIDRGRLADCRDLRSLQILAGVLTDDVQDASLYDELVARLQRRL